MILKTRGSIPLFHPTIVLLEWKRWDAIPNVTVSDDFSFLSFNKTKKNLFVNYVYYSDLYNKLSDADIDSTLPEDLDTIVYDPVRRYSETVKIEDLRLSISKGNFLKKLKDYSSNNPTSNSKNKIYYYMLKYLSILQNSSIIEKFKQYSDIYNSLDLYEKVIFNINLTSFILFKIKNFNSLFLIARFLKFKDLGIKNYSVNLNLNFLLIYNVVINFGGTKNKKTANIKRRIKKKIVKLHNI